MITIVNSNPHLKYILSKKYLVYTAIAIQNSELIRIAFASKNYTSLFYMQNNNETQNK